jgi:hypothetical protein
MKQFFIEVMNTFLKPFRTKYILVPWQMEQFDVIAHDSYSVQAKLSVIRVPC